MHGLSDMQPLNMVILHVGIFCFPSQICVGRRFLHVSCWFPHRFLLGSPGGRWFCSPNTSQVSHPALRWKNTDVGKAKLRFTYPESKPSSPHTSVSFLKRTNRVYGLTVGLDESNQQLCFICKRCCTVCRLSRSVLKKMHQIAKIHFCLPSESSTRKTPRNPNIIRWTHFQSVS